MLLHKLACTSNMYFFGCRASNQACAQYTDNIIVSFLLTLQTPFLGTRVRDNKGQLGAYTWMTYNQVRIIFSLRLTHQLLTSFVEVGRVPCMRNILHGSEHVWSSDVGAWSDVMLSTCDCEYAISQTPCPRSSAKWSMGIDVTTSQK